MGKKQNSYIALIVILFVLGFVVGMSYARKQIKETEKQIALENFAAGYEAGRQSYYLESGQMIGMLEISEEDIQPLTKARENFEERQSLYTAEVLYNEVKDLTEKINATTN